MDRRGINMRRTEPLVTGNVYHILNKSIAGYEIFTSEREFVYMIRLIRFFSINESFPKFSRFVLEAESKGKSVEQLLKERENENGTNVDIIAYSIMPTHFHFILRQLKDDSISDLMGSVSGSYALNFNKDHNRKGRLWEDKFKNVPVISDEQLLHLTRYLHLNATTAGLVNNPEDWKYSSYYEYISPETVDYPFCKFRDLIDINPSEYKEFVENQKDYQRELAKIKKIALE